jgi:hypothetical protein
LPKYVTAPYPPEAGDVIAFQQLEMNQTTFCPELSEFKEAKILTYDEDSDEVRLRLSPHFVPGPTNGKYDDPNAMQYDDEDDELMDTRRKGRLPRNALAFSFDDDEASANEHVQDKPDILVCFWKQLSNVRRVPSQ